MRRPAAGIGLFPLGAVSAHAAQQSVGRLRTAFHQGGIAGLARAKPIDRLRGHRPLGRLHHPFGEGRIKEIRRHYLRQWRHRPLSRRCRPLGRLHRPTRGTSSPFEGRHILRRRQHIAHRRVHIPRSRRHRPFGKERIEERRGYRPLGRLHPPLGEGRIKEIRGHYLRQWRHRPTRGTGRPTREGRISRRRGRLDQFAVCVERK